MSNQNPQHVVTGRVRLSYVHLFTPYVNPNGNGEPKYSVTILIPKSDVATKQRIDAAINAAIQQGINEKFNGVRPPVLAIPIHDGDGVRPSDGMPFGDECKGHWVLTASSKQKPEVVDLNLNPIINQTEVYSGIYARVSMRFFPYNSNGKKGIGCGLGNVQKLEDGEPLGGRTTAASDFADSMPSYHAGNQQTAGYQQQYNAPAAPVYPQQQPNYAQPAQQVQQPVFPQQPVQIDPVTGKPMTGGIMGLS